MKIRFETTMEDMLAFHRFHYANSPSWRGQIWKQRLVLPVVLALLLVLASLGRDELDPPFLIIFGLTALVASIVWALLVPSWLSRCLDRNIRKLLAEGSNRTLLGWRDMELADNRLLVKTAYIDSRIDLRAIEKIVGDDQYTFVYIASVSAFVIPMQRWPEDEYRQFVGELQQAWENVDQTEGHMESVSEDDDTIMIRRGPPGEVKGPALRSER